MFHHQLRSKVKSRLLIHRRVLSSKNDGIDLAPPKFPCLDQHLAREERLKHQQSPNAKTVDSGPEPVYGRITKGFKLYHYNQPNPFKLCLGGQLDTFQLGSLSQDLNFSL
jgi:hypothetical protein